MCADDRQWEGALQAVQGLTVDQRELFQAISDLSEECYCADWVIGTKHNVWRLIHHGGSWGLWRFQVEATQLDRVRRAMSRAQCWIVWDGAGPAPGSVGAVACPARRIGRLVSARRRGRGRSRRGRVGALSVGLVALLAVFTLRGPPHLLQTLRGSASPRMVQSADGRLQVYAEPDSGAGPVLDVITGALRSVDMTMYELRDTAVEQALSADARRGVLVRVVLDQNLERARNQAAFDYLARHRVHAVWAPAAYAATHQKTVTADRQVWLVLTGNLVAADYASTRDFAILDRRPADVAAIEATFQADYAGVEITPPRGSALVWSPTSSESGLLAVISGARHALVIENEEMADPQVTEALLGAAARRHVAVTVVMTANPRWDTALGQLRTAGVRVAVYPDSAGALYIHAKALVADAGWSTARMMVGSQLLGVLTDPQPGAGPDHHRSGAGEDGREGDCR